MDIRNNLNSLDLNKSIKKELYEEDELVVILDICKCHISKNTIKIGTNIFLDLIF